MLRFASGALDKPATLLYIEAKAFRHER